MQESNGSINDKNSFYEKAFSRNIGLLTEEEQNTLRNTKVAIVGMGGVGGFHLISLVRMGIGKFNIADMDTYELANIQRQCGAFMDTLGQNKSEVMKKIALSINPHLEIKSFNEGVSSENISDFMADADVLIDGIDFFSINERRFMFKEAKNKGIYAVTAGPLGFSSAMLVFSPDGMSFDEYFDINDDMTCFEKIIAFGVGLAPASLHMNYYNLNKVDLNSKKGPSLVSACNLCCSLVSTEVLKMLFNKKMLKSAPHYLQFDPFLQKLKKGYLMGGNKNIIQKIKRWYMLKKFSSKK